MGKDILDEKVRTALVDNVSAVVGGGLLKDSWVENRLSKYVVVKSILEAEWLKDGPGKLKGGRGEQVWGRRNRVVVSRVGKKGSERVSVKLEVVSGVMAVSLVRE